jgi:hypothetical protein
MSNGEMIRVHHFATNPQTEMKNDIHAPIGLASAAKR